MKLRNLGLVALGLASLLPAKADEGMWLLPMLKQQNSESLQALGLEMDVDDIYNPNGTSLKDAVVIFGGGCTGEIISSEGLLLTNHHCGYGSIQQHSSVEHDYLTDGFWAMKKEEELPTPGLEVRFIDRIEEVTDYVKEALAEEAKKDPMVMYDAARLNELAEEKLGEEYLEKYPWVEVIIKPFYGGNSYYLYEMKVYSDIRMVGAPPSSIGKFGADTDNWMWPRHTGDFSLFRVYTDKEGNPADYAEDNIPLNPKRYFNISLKGVQENDFAMIMGFPGTTNRYYTSGEVEQRRDVANQVFIDVRGVRQEVMLEEMLNDPAVRIQYASKYAQSSNYWKNSIGMNRGINKLQVVEGKVEDETQLREWATANNQPQYIAALDTMLSITAKMEQPTYELYMMSEALLRGIEFSGVPLPTKELKEAIASKDKEAIAKELKTYEERYRAFANKDYSRKVDNRIAKVMLATYAEAVAPENRPSIFAYIDKKFKGNYAKFVDEAFEESIFGSDENFAKFLKKPSVKALEKDLMVMYASSVRQQMNVVRNTTSPYTEKLADAKRTYIAGLLAMNQGKPSYPDANFTMRLTYGQVLPYSPSDGVDYKYYTTLDGVMQKEDPNNWEFVVPSHLKELYETKNFGEYALPNGKMPCGFISNNDITGGNSGSPVINANGELIGAAFDGNWEAMSGDIVFEPALQRTISVDIRYILFIIDKYAGATNLIEEMTIIR